MATRTRFQAAQRAYYHNPSLQADQRKAVVGNLLVKLVVLATRASGN